MEENIIATETVEEVAEITQGSGNGLKVFGGVLAIAGLAYGGYRLLKNRKKKKEQEEEPAAVFNLEPDNDGDIEE